jgi:hypothetical protein
MNKKIILVLMSAVFIGYALNSHAQANQKLSDLLAPTAVNQNLVPGNNNLDLGNSTRQWKNLYLRDSLYLNGILTMHAPGINNFFIGPAAGSNVELDSGNTAMGTNAALSHLLKNASLL